MAPQASDAGTAALCAQSVRDDGDRATSAMGFADEGSAHLQRYSGQSYLRKRAVTFPEPLLANNMIPSKWAPAYRVPAPCTAVLSRI